MVMAIRVLQSKLLPKPGMYSHGVEAGELVVVAGQIGLTADGKLAGTDVVTQTRQVFANIAAVLDAAGCGMADIVRLQTFLVNPDDVAGFRAARQELFPKYFPNGAYPPNTLLIVAGLTEPELRIEIEAMAVKPDGSAPKGRQ
jgi:2-iminobutanoate/2-iminopropanoate deaminase